MVEKVKSMKEGTPGHFMADKIFHFSRYKIIYNVASFFELSTVHVIFCFRLK